MISAHPRKWSGLNVSVAHFDKLMPGMHIKARRTKCVYVCMCVATLDLVTIRMTP